MARDLKPTAMDEMLEDLASNFTQEKYIHAMAHDYKRARDLPKAITGIHFSRCMNWRTDARYNLNIAIQKTESNIAKLDRLAKLQYRYARSNSWMYCRHKHSNIIKCLNGEKVILQNLQDMKREAA